MNYTFMPSLKHRALVKITAALWNHSYIRDLVARWSILDYPYSMGKAEWQVIDDMVIARVTKLPLPESLKKEMLNLTQRIGLEVKKWKVYHEYEDELSLGSDVVQLGSNELCWTPQGTVDRKKTAKVLIKDENIDITIRYLLACIYCLEDDLKKLWKSIPQKEKKGFYDGSVFNLSFSVPKKQIMLWTYEITGESTKSSDLIKNAGSEMSPYQFQFQYAAEYGNKVATEYFMQKLTPREREESLVKCAKDIANKHFCLSKRCDDVEYLVDFEVNDADTMCFLLSQMNEEQQAKVLESCPAGVLSCLLEWPWETFFMETANRVWGFLYEEHYELLLNVMVRRIAHGSNNCNYHKLFGEFWQQSPNTYKKYVIGSDWFSLIEDLFKIGDKENVRLIFKYTTVKEREELIFSNKGKLICESLIYKNKWDLLKIFVQECISSEDMMIKFKEKWKPIISSLLEQRLVRENDYHMFFQFLDDFIHKDNKKRVMEEGNISPGKRL